MKSLTDLYRIGYGPSSSHTMGPAKAARIAKEKCPDADGFRVILYSSLAKTGKGHMTDAVLRKVVERIGESKAGERWLNAIEPLMLFLLLAVCTAFLVDGSFNPFLYFRF